MDPVEWINIPIVQGGFATLVVGVLVAVFTGRLLPRWWVTQLRESDQKTIERQREEIKEWRDAFRTSDQANRVLITHVGELMETGRITERILTTVAEKGGEQ